MPKPQDDIDKLAYKIFKKVINYKNTLEKYGIAGGSHAGAPNERLIIRGIIALLQSSNREARIDELENAFREFSKNVPFNERLAYYDNRLSKLKGGE